MAGNRTKSLESADMEGGDADGSCAVLDPIRTALDHNCAIRAPHVVVVWLVQTARSTYNQVH